MPPSLCDRDVKQHSTRTVRHVQHGLLLNSRDVLDVYAPRSMKQLGPYQLGEPSGSPGLKLNH